MESALQGRLNHTSGKAISVRRDLGWSFGGL
jgi:hypothetical protein